MLIVIKPRPFHELCNQCGSGQNHVFHHCETSEQMQPSGTVTGKKCVVSRSEDFVSRACRRGPGGSAGAGWRVHDLQHLIELQAAHKTPDPLIDKSCRPVDYHYPNKQTSRRSPPNTLPEVENGTWFISLLFRARFAVQYCRGV